MKKKQLYIFFVSLVILLSSAFPAFWKEWISLPGLRLLGSFGAHLPFSVLEWSIAGLSIWMLVSFSADILRRKLIPGVIRLIKRLFCLMMCALTVVSALWLPLYDEACTIPVPEKARLQICCSRLIDALNASALDFESPPDDLPAKFAAFPFWMRALNISGFYSFFTGEALVSPDINACALPFVAVHESIHGRGIADEGRCNILAWEECMLRGGGYADSARLWALSYALSALRDVDAPAYSDCLRQMNPNTLQSYRLLGGTYSRPEKGALQTAFAHLGGTATQNYEILALWLAANMG